MISPQEIAHLFFDIQVHIKLYHWMTTSYARHKASDQLLEELVPKVDKFIEILFGRYGRPKRIPQQKLTYGVLSEKAIITYLQEKRSQLEMLNLATLQHLNIGWSALHSERLRAHQTLLCIERS